MTSEALTIGALIAFQMFASRLIGPVLRMTGLWQEFQQVSVAVRRLADIMDVPQEPYALASERGTAALARLECRDLGFRYSSARPWLFQHLSFVLEPGQCMALTGASGRGKSTVTRLLQGFYPVEHGQILIDGVDTRDLAANQLRSYFGIVPQESRLFSGTILQNIIGDGQYPDLEAAIEACQLAQVHATIEALPRGYLSLIGENGAGLSGGQKQRLAIARALVRRPRILMFDESTSNLDAELTASLMQVISALRGKVSVLFVAHDVPIGLNPDSVICLDAVRFAGRGT
jgi:subfamily B ATP-binding cassette protein HlyB/CyaB